MSGGSVMPQEIVTSQSNRPCNIGTGTLPGQREQNVGRPDAAWQDERKSATPEANRHHPDFEQRVPRAVMMQEGRHAQILF